MQPNSTFAKRRNLYFFILGNQPWLSQAELSSFGSLKLFLKSSEAVLISTDEFIEPQMIIKKLGGAVKMGVIVKISTEQNDKNNSTAFSPSNIIHVLTNLILQELAEPIKQKQKIFFGLGLYRLNDRLLTNKLIDCRRQSRLNGATASSNLTISQLSNLAISVKHNLKQKKVKCRWVASRETNLSSVIVKTNKLLSAKGIEIILLIAPDKIFIGKTLAVQEFAEQKTRDSGRPTRDAKSGMLPPKLAKIMLNLGLADNDNKFKARPNVSNGSITILDPFCGSGTIIGEALNMFLEANKNLTLDHIIGADISAIAVKQAKANIKWLIKTIRPPGQPLPKLTFLQADVKNLSKKIQTHSVDLIITEPYLGPPLCGNESLDQLQQIQTELKILHLKAFAEFKKILQRQSSRLVIIFPIFKTRTGDQYLDILADLEKIGFKIKKFPDIAVNKRGGLEYGRPGQKLWREIFVFEIPNLTSTSAGR